MTPQSLSAYAILLDYLTNTNPATPKPIIRGFDFIETETILMLYNTDGIIYAITTNDDGYVFTTAQYPTIKNITTNFRDNILRWALNNDKNELINTIFGTEKKYALLYYHLFTDCYYCYEEESIAIDTDTIEYNQWYKEFKTGETFRLFDDWITYEGVRARI